MQMLRTGIVIAVGHSNNSAQSGKWAQPLWYLKLQGAFRSESNQWFWWNPQFGMVWFEHMRTECARQTWLPLLRRLGEQCVRVCLNAILFRQLLSRRRPESAPDSLPFAPETWRSMCVCVCACVCVCVCVWLPPLSMFKRFREAY